MKAKEILIEELEDEASLHPCDVDEAIFIALEFYWKNHWTSQNNTKAAHVARYMTDRIKAEDEEYFK